MVKSILLQRHIYGEHFYDSASHHNRVLYKLVGLIFGTGCHKTLATASKSARGRGT
jgi:hypothetical protein